MTERKTNRSKAEAPTPGAGMPQTPAPNANAPLAKRPTPSTSTHTRTRMRVRLVAFGACAVLLLFFAVFARQLCPYDPYQQDLSQALMPPSPAHPAGTDRFGRDLLSRVIMGAQPSVLATLALVAIICVVGTGVGVAAGWWGGTFDTVLMRVADVFLAFPNLVFALAVAGVLGGGVLNAVVAIAVVSWPKYARLARGLVLAQRNEPFMEAAQLAGCSVPQLIVGHVLPNIAGSLLVTAMLDMGTMMMELAALSFLGLGAQPPMAEWGSMMSESRSLLQTAPWTVFAPGIAIFVTVAVCNLLGDAVHDWLDPARR